MASKAGVIASEKTRLKFIPVSAVRMRDGFWKTRMEKNHQYGVPRLLQHLEDHKTIAAFRITSGRETGTRPELCYTDSDLYKWMEGASLDLQTYNDPELKAKLDSVIDDVIAAQGEDGYLNTYFQFDRAAERFTKLGSHHEIYCAGHLFQAAVANYRATGDDKLLSCACRYADYLVSVFGYDKRQGVDGHPEVEMALVELYRTTGNRNYLDLAEYFLTQLKFREMPELRGHAVRALYTCCGGADYFAETGDAAYGEAANRLWTDLVTKKMYITGGVGSRYAGEAIGEAYELPNSRAYAETCAAIANMMFNYRMLAVYGDGRFADEIERALYNGVVSGVSMDGVAYFYMNPLSRFSPYARQEWFDCTCCPTNMVRTLASIPGYMYSISDEGVWVHLFDNSEVNYKLADGTRFTLEQTTNYPWNGEVEIKIGLDAPKEFTIYIRRPGWSKVQQAQGTIENGYEAIRRVWNPGDVLRVQIDMTPKLQEADPRVRENYNQVAAQFGPLIYCAESVDNPDVSIRDLALVSGEFKPEFKSDLLGGVVVLRGFGATSGAEVEERGPLYRPVGSYPSPKLREVPVKLIPYHAWANRGQSQMTVWMPNSRK